MQSERTITDYQDGAEPHSDGISVERSVLSDGSVAYNVLYRDTAAAADAKGRPLALRFACTSEEAAWDFADELAAVSWVEEIEIGLVLARRWRAQPGERGR